MTGTSPSLRRMRILIKLDSWLFLSSARGCMIGDNENNQNDSEKISSKHGDGDVVPPMMPVERALPKSGFPIERRMATQREDSGLTMMMINALNCFQNLRTTWYHRGHEEIVNIRRSIAPLVTSRNREPKEDHDTFL